jgi:DNA-directed RNA polymerase specialized sigma24 family protein
MSDTQDCGPHNDAAWAFACEVYGLDIASRHDEDTMQEAVLAAYTYARARLAKGGALPKSVRAWARWLVANAKRAQGRDRKAQREPIGETYRSLHIQYSRSRFSSPCGFFQGRATASNWVPVNEDWQDFLSGQSHARQAIAQLRAEGHTIPECARILGSTPRAVWGIVERMYRDYIAVS